ncbi:hypothetical protein PVAP13_5NG566100 [Panicum virgatum]|uniref:Uncharacterized protein n=1 Tax=Panicum virgatum TaxID=38727 RepID=A0A8T0S695_PANVG|nr:hypothetical protein PVAP13_5NG566100 [Panicum virgatum]
MRPGSAGDVLSEEQGNLSQLFKSIEDYEKSLEAKQATAVGGS